MRTILAARNIIAQVWGFPKSKDTSYRLMKYLLKIEVDEGLLLHNTVTGHLILLSQEEAKLVSQLPARPTEQMQELIANHFLVPIDFDEYRSVKQLRMILQSRSTGDAINHFVILPTTFCNAHCFYCYESDFPRVQMSADTGERVLEFISEHRKNEEVQLSWFGGEPLVGIERIDQITQGLMKRGIPYSSTMISNGYLFDEEIVRRSKELWNLQRVQITLDGTENVYNQVKAYACVKDNPYKRVLKNIDLLSQAEILVMIRLNVDFYNKEDVGELIEELGMRYSGNKNVMVYLNMLFNDQGYNPVRHSRNEMLELLQIIHLYTERLKELKVQHQGSKIPSLQFSQCMADDCHAIEIQPDGSFCRCEHETIKDRYGSLVDGIIDMQKLIKWRETVERSAQCPDCRLYPSCYMLKQCMGADMPCEDDTRSKGLAEIKMGLYSVYHKSLEEKKNERVSGTQNRSCAI